MRVLHVLNELRPSGAEEMLRIAGPYWKSLGCDLHILCIAEHPGDFATRLTAAGWTIHATGPKSGPLGLGKTLRRMIREIHPDVLHLHPEGYGLLPPAVGWLCRVPMARTVHNAFGFGGALRLRKSLERRLARLLGVRFVAIGESVLENERDRFHNPCQLCWNWIDTDRFRPPTVTERAAARARFGIPDDQFAVVSVGNGSDVKNYRAVVEALPLLAEPRVFYYQIGHPHPDGTDDQCAARLGVESQVRFCGPSHEVLEWLWATDVFAMPSLYEGFGLAAVEGLAAGCHCVFADCPGLRDFKNLDVPAVWVAPTAPAFAQAIRSILDSPALPVKRTNRGAQEAREVFSATRRAHAYFELWKSLAR